MASGRVEKKGKSGLLFQGFYFKMCPFNRQKRGDWLEKLLQFPLTTYFSR